MQFLYNAIYINVSSTVKYFDFRTAEKVSNIRIIKIVSNIQLKDIAEAISICDRILVLSKRPAVILDDVRLDDMKSLSALERREHARFSELFERIWHELE